MRSDRPRGYILEWSDGSTLHTGRATLVRDDAGKPLYIETEHAIYNFRYIRSLRLSTRVENVPPIIPPDAVQDVWEDFVKLNPRAVIIPEGDDHGIQPNSDEQG